MNNSQRDQKIIEHEILLRETRKDVLEIKKLLSNHISEVLGRFDRYRTLFTSALVTLIFTLIGTILTLMLQLIN